MGWARACGFGLAPGELLPSAPMATLACPQCAHAIDCGETDDGPPSVCPSCSASLRVAYRYILEADLGEIAGGFLYRGLDESSGRAVAVLYVTDPDDEALGRRFVEGYRAFADLAAPGVIKIHEVGGGGGSRAYVVRDWIAGGTLEQRVSKHGPLGAEELGALCSAMLGALAYAHRSVPSVVHGHLHPGKIGFLEPGSSPVLFGMEWAARVLDQDSALADTLLSAEAKVDPGDAPSPSRDLRQLGRTIAYAATGTWMGEFDRAQERALVRAQGPTLGPALGVTLDRLLCAGTPEGYRTGVDARMDFSQLLRGNDFWRPRKVPKVRAEESASLDAYMRTAEPAAGEPASTNSLFSTSSPVSPVSVALDSASINSAMAQAAEAAREEALTPNFDVDELLDQLSSVRTDPAVHDDDWDEWQTPPSGLRSPRGMSLVPEPEPGLEPRSSEPPPQLGNVFKVILLMVFMGVVVAAVEAFQDNSPDSYTEALPPTIEPVPWPIDEPVPVPEPAVAAPALHHLHHWEAEVVGPSEGRSGAELGDTCDLWVGPTDASSTYSTRFYVDCGEPRRRIYGGGTVGFIRAEISEGHPTMGLDIGDEDGDGEVFFNIGEGAGQLDLQDRFQRPPINLEFRLSEDGGQVQDGRVQPDLDPPERSDEPAPGVALGLPKDGEPEDDRPDELSRDQLLTGLNATRDALENCEVDSGETLRITVEIGVSGEVTSVGLDETLASTIQDCVRAAVEGASFPAFVDGPMKVAWPVTW